MQTVKPNRRGSLVGQGVIPEARRQETSRRSPDQWSPGGSTWTSFADYSGSPRYPYRCSLLRFVATHPALCRVRQGAVRAGEARIAYTLSDAG